MKEHYCLADKTTISYEGECNWCGEKEMKQEPVAWQWLDTANFRKKLSETANKDEWTPLYTAPRELSDDYVFVCKKCGDEIGIKYEPKQKLSDEEIQTLKDLYTDDVYGNGLDVMSFARAILKKASEK